MTKPVPTWIAAMLTWGWMPPMAYLFMDEPMRREAVGIVAGLAAIVVGVVGMGMLAGARRPWRQ